MNMILESIRLFFAPLKYKWFWAVVIVLAIVLTNTAEAGYMWTD